MDVGEGVVGLVDDDPSTPGRQAGHGRPLHREPAEIQLFVGLGEKHAEHSVFDFFAVT